MHVAVVDADPRYRYLADWLKLKHRVSLLHPDDDIPVADALVWPVKGPDKRDAKWRQIPYHFCGIAPAFLLKDVFASGGKVIEWMKDDSVSWYQAGLTAEGILMHVLSDTDKSIFETSIAVVGAGKTGISIARRLAAVGANVGCYTHFQIEKSRLKALLLKEITSIEEVDIVINTIPAAVIDKTSQASLVLDIVTAKDMFIHAPNAEYKKLPSLPAIVAPRSSGENIAQFIEWESQNG
ncbi:hypothetical protein FLK61_32305 [Paenalkalicoccus suaedae]|uniref:D-isomer specific 2-hydroxyacid dehydrogenase NAD-binding domain-containing protein n=1 Tax=Paenalkalicoccus suaedae TaxID=2592382 RepID=A0A859FGQ1_9BACI|nr:hypothetical protein [Paenalkalicoccus suaedae]QKS71385.1 hypothetical protein FLK61_32305 [Paenalkalicoccus suaedae]